MILIKENGDNFDKSKEVISQFSKDPDTFLVIIKKIFFKYELNNKLTFQEEYDSYENNYFLYDYSKNVVHFSFLTDHKINRNFSMINNNFSLTPEFYDGFGHDL